MKERPLKTCSEVDELFKKNVEIYKGTCKSQIVIMIRTDYKDKIGYYRIRSLDFAYPRGDKFGEN